MGHERQRAGQGEAGGESGGEASNLLCQLVTYFFCWYLADWSDSQFTVGVNL